MKEFRFELQVDYRTADLCILKLANGQSITKYIEDPKIISNDDARLYYVRVWLVTLMFKIAESGEIYDIQVYKKHTNTNDNTALSIFKTYLENAPKFDVTTSNASGVIWKPNKTYKLGVRGIKIN